MFSYDLFLKTGIFINFTGHFPGSGGIFQNRESGRSLFISGDSRSNREGWNVCYLFY